VIAETDTRSSGTGESLRLMVDEFARLQRESVHPAELQGAQDFIAGHFPLSIEAPASIAEEVLSHLFYEQSLSEIDPITRVAPVVPPIQRVARASLKPDLSIVLVGDASAFISQLRAMGFNEPADPAR
jgi:predicted Zn-dependent peptidase